MRRDEHTRPVLDELRDWIDGFPHEREPGRKRDWHRTYNTFLASCTHIGLTPEHFACTKFPRQRARKSLDAFLTLHERQQLSQRRHGILPYNGEDCILRVDDVDQQLALYDSRRPEVVLAPRDALG